MLIIITPPHALPDEECIVNKLFESGLHLLTCESRELTGKRWNVTFGVSDHVSGSVLSCTTTSNWRKSTG